MWHVLYQAEEYIGPSHSYLDDQKALGCSVLGKATRNFILLFVLTARLEKAVKEGEWPRLDVKEDRYHSQQFCRK